MEKLTELKGWVWVLADTTLPCHWLKPLLCEVRTGAQILRNPHTCRVGMAAHIQ